MLPHILHSTGRAVAVVHNQTHTIRNVLQLQSSGPSSGSGASWGNGPGPGGSKYGAGSRFYAGHNSAGRAVTQANAVTSHDGQLSQTDDIEEVTPKWTVLPTPQRKPRMRSSSMSMGVAGRNERAERLGVLKTVQLHTRAKHAFAAPPAESMSSAKERLLADALPAPQPTQPLLVRRNSTSAPLSPLLTPTDSPVSPSTPKQKHQEPAKPSAEVDEKPASTPAPEKQFQAEIEHFRAISQTTDASGVAKSVRRMLLQHENPPVEVFNAALSAFVKTRALGSSLGPIIDLYNVMLSKSILPNVETYELLITALTARDIEVHRAKVSLDIRSKQKEHMGRAASALVEQDQNRRAELDEEDNFGSAMSLFEGVLAVGGKDQLQIPTFVRLMNCAANHADVHSAIHVFAQMEARPDTAIPIPVYRYLVLTFSNANQIEQAEEIFKTFLTAGAHNKLARYPRHLQQVARQNQIQVWNTMIEAYFRAGMPDKAIELVDQVLRSDAGDNFTVADIPVATSSMFTTVISGFLTSGDIASALAWFDKLLLQEKTPEDPYQGLSGSVMRPDALAWFLMIDHLADHGMIDDLNRLFKVLKKLSVDDGIRISSTVRLIAYTANVEHLENNTTIDPIAAIETLKFLLADLQECNAWDIPRGKLAMRMCHELAIRGELDSSAIAFNNVTASGLVYQEMERESPVRHKRTQDSTSQFISDVYTAVHSGIGSISFTPALALARLAHQLAMVPDLRFAPAFLHAYGTVKNDSGVPQMTAEDWQLVFTYAVHLEMNAAQVYAEDFPEIPGFAFRGVLSLVEDFNSQGHAFDSLNEDIRHRVITIINAHVPAESRQTVLEQYGPKYVEAAEKFDQLKFAALENAVVDGASIFNPVEAQVLPTETRPLLQDAYLSKAIAAALGPVTGMLRPEALSRAYKMFERSIARGTVPNTDVLCRLIEAEGRAKDLDKVRELYTAAQAMLPTIPAESQRYDWAAVENSMIIALAHAGHVDAAHVHRVRILEQGLCPSADAYGILVQLVRDTTDDTSGAVALFEEALARGVTPNMYLYNNIISKLSRARKADYALELFEQMKASGIKVSSITYGAVIGACARVGDVVSAESLFKEMVRSRNFRPRVPPYNTMMQLYTTTKPNRTSALYYYNEMKKAGVKPSSHTYKLLLDAYGSLEPVALEPMEAVFAELLADTSVEVTGAHFASLINAYGCVSKDLNKAISVFESMGTYPRAPKPDAVAFEAILNAIVAHKQTALLPVYINKMVEAGVHMTAYIANFLIKGYANVGEMDKAREIFESLSNPPTGVAAPNNHAPHSPELGADVPVMAPVYREPSTWEVMVRAELGAGNREAALALLERLQERQYPEAVYSRISGILTDFSVPQ